MLFERQTEEGSEMVPVLNLTLGDNVRCLKAARGPRTTTPEMGWCKFIVRGHNLDTPLMYDQVLFVDERGQQQMIAATKDHLVWSSPDTTLKGTVDPKKIPIQNGMFVPISSIIAGDVIIHESDGVWSYRTVTEHRVESMDGIRNPSFNDGGLPLVNGVLATTSANFYRGGHWGTYFQNLWNQDLKFSNSSQAYYDAKAHPFSVAQKKGFLKVDVDCLVDQVLEDLDNGIDGSLLPSYEEFAKIYVLPCIGELPSLADVGEVLLDDFEQAEYKKNLEQQAGALHQIEPMF